MKSWIMVDDGSQKPFGFECLRCGAYQKVNQPIKLSDFVILENIFIAEHRGCKVKKPDPHGFRSNRIQKWPNEANDGLD